MWDVAPVWDVARTLLWLSFNTSFGFAAFVLPLIVLLAIAYAAHVRHRRTRALAWRAAVWAFGAAVLVYVAFAGFVMHAISLSRRSTAMLGLVEIPFGGIPLSVATSLLVWSTAVVVLKWRDSHTRRSPSADAAGMPISNRVAPISSRGAAISSRVAATALLILTAAGGLFVANAYTAHLVAVSAQAHSADQLRQIAHGRWAHLDSRVLAAVARNESIPEDLVCELRDASDDVQTELAYNPSTPLPVVLDMSATNWSAAHVVADARSRYARAVTPDMLRTISTGPFACSLSDALAKNPTTPADVRDDLSRQSPCRDHPEARVRRGRSRTCPARPQPS